MSVINVSSYAFFPISDPQALRLDILENFQNTNLLGTILLAEEGVNFYVSSSERELLARLKNFLLARGAPADLLMKESPSEGPPFTRLKVVVKNEICKLGVEGMDVLEWKAPTVKSNDFHQWIENDPDVLILDNRNTFEFRMGTFRGAKHFGMDKFTEFPQVVEHIRKTYGEKQKVAMFCTGGIRCEKGAAYMRSQGFENVFQLEGGILKYFEDRGQEGWNGSCFVFDSRGYVDPDLSAFNSEGQKFPQNLKIMTSRPTTFNEAE